MLDEPTRGIRVNSISPAYTATPMNLRPEVAEQVKKFEADTPLGRMATVDELVGPAIFFVEPGGILLHRRRPGCRRRVRLLVMSCALGAPVFFLKWGNAWGRGRKVRPHQPLPGPAGQGQRPRTSLRRSLPTSSARQLEFSRRWRAQSLNRRIGRPEKPYGLTVVVGLPLY
jgi:Enoyl-(Acyl carrier protein) reductase